MSFCLETKNVWHVQITRLSLFCCNTNKIEKVIQFEINSETDINRPLMALVWCINRSTLICEILFCNNIPLTYLCVIVIKSSFTFTFFVYSCIWCNQNHINAISKCSLKCRQSSQKILIWFKKVFIGNSIDWLWQQFCLISLNRVFFLI